LNVIYFLDSQSDRSFALEWLENILALNGVNISPTQRNDISQALASMSASEAGRSLSNFCTTVQDNSIREALKQYTIAGEFGALFDATNDGLNLNADFTVFETYDLSYLARKICFLCQLLELFKFVFRLVINP